MQRSMSVVLVLMGPCLLAEWATAADYGRFRVGPAERKEIVIGPAARELRVCNDFESGGTFVIVLGGHEPHVLEGATAVAAGQDGDLEVGHGKGAVGTAQRG